MRRRPSDLIHATWDAIVVGSGASGGVAALTWLREVLAFCWWMPALTWRLTPLSAPSQAI